MEEKVTATSKMKLVKDILLTSDKAKLDKIGEILLSETPTDVSTDVKLEMVKSMDGSVTFEAENWNPGTPVFIVNPDGNVALPAGEYELETGQMLIVVEDGVISEVKEAMPEQPEQEMSEETTSQPTAQTTAQQIAKKTVESTVKETYFSAEEKEKLEKEIVELKAQLEATEETPKPITHNPEREGSKREPVKLGRSIEENVRTLMYG